MDNLTLILLISVGILIIILILVLVILGKKLKTRGSREEAELLQETLRTLRDDLKTDIRETRQEIDQKIYVGQKDMNENVKYQFETSQKLINDIHEHLGRVNQSVTEVKEGSKQVLSMTEQLANLEKVLTNQKTRGNWGEGSLELILSNYLGGQYEMQYRYQNGEIVDAVIKMRDKYLPIDSKFSIDNYRRTLDTENEEDREYFANEFKKDIKKRIEETAKYVDELKERTTSFALMFIPSEAIYYDLNAGLTGSLKIDTEKLLDYAKSKRVHLVSPSSILPFIYLILSGIKDQKIEESAKEIKQKVEALGKHIHSYEDYMKKLGNSLNTTVNHYNTSYKELRKIDKDIYKIGNGAGELIVEPLLIDKVNIEEY